LALGKNPHLRVKIRELRLRIFFFRCVCVGQTKSGRAWERIKSRK
jgi:hypothetical protein